MKAHCIAFSDTTRSISRAMIAASKAAFLNEGVERMLTIKNEYIENIPLLLVEEEDSIREKPIFFFLHGITSAKEHNLHIAYTIAQKGFRVILPDALHHGERETTDSERMRYRLFWKIILQSIEEFPLLVEGLAKKGLASKENIAIGGTSMGAITTFGALATYKWIKSAVAFMGAPQYDQFAKQMFQVADESGMDIKEGEKEAILAKIEPYDLSSHLELLNNRPLFIWHGKEDKTVPFAIVSHLRNNYKKVVRLTVTILLFMLKMGLITKYQERQCLKLEHGSLK